mmetsp:Transcript_25001/g.57809  ORF Transcript_25001/g.57809 Transcript_25001/m.57809 type:complete len:95 (+) Transcript_25001:209-493(+)
MEAAHALLESRPERLGRGGRRGPTAVSVIGASARPHTTQSSPPRGVPKVHRILGQAWRNGQACVRASLADGSVHVIPIELVDPSVFLRWREGKG